MAGKLLRVLIVDDSADDAQLMLMQLRKAWAELVHLRVDSRESVQAALKQPWDIVLCDHNMPGFNSLDALALLKETGQDLPLILVSGAIGEDLAVQIVKAGAHDFVFKDHLARLNVAVDRELGEAEVRRAKKAAEEKLRVSNERLRQAFEGSVQALALITEMRDPCTSGHQRRVAELAWVIARELGLSEEATAGLRMAALIHDLGKVAVPAEILSKPGTLSRTEFSLVKVHAEIGYDILKGIAFPWPVADIVHQHHERLDGSGYPQGLRAAEILPEAKILAVADVVEAMSSHRPYRPALGRDRALQEVTRGRGVIFEDAVVGACLKVFPGINLGDSGQPDS